MEPNGLKLNAIKDLKKTITLFSLLLTVSLCFIIPFINCLEKEYREIQEKILVELDNENWDEYISKHEYVFVLFYKKNTKFSEDILIEIKKSLSHVANKNILFGLVEKDDPKSELIISEQNIRSFPKLILYYLRHPIEYEYGYLSENINLFLSKKQENKVSEIYKYDEYLEFRKLKESVIYVGDTLTKDMPMAKKMKYEDKKYFSFLYASKLYDDVVFAECQTVNCFENFDSFVGLVSIYNGFHNEKHDLDSFSSSQLLAFINEKTTRVFPELDEGASRIIFNGYSAGLFLFLDKQNDNQKKYILEFKLAARNLKKALHLVIAEYNSEMGSQVVEILKLKFADLPKVFIIDCRKEEIQLHRMDKQITEKNIFEFSTNWGLNKLTPLVFSEEIPLKQTFPILTVVGKNYKELVINSNNNFIVYYYSPLCEPCKKFEKIYRKIANAIIKDSKDIILFGKINGEMNDVEAVSILAYPSIIFYLKGKKEKPVKYEIEDYDLANFVKFIISNMQGELDYETVMNNIKLAEEENKVDIKNNKNNYDENENNSENTDTGNINVNYVESKNKEEI